MDQDLLRQARSAGIEPSFLDVDGIERKADETSLRLLLELLARPDASGDVLVVRDGDAIDLDISKDDDRPVVATLCKRNHVLARSQERQLALPDDLPRGDYRLDLALQEGVQKSLTLLHTPSRAYQPDFALEGRRSWVLSVQLYSLSNARNFGHGDFTDLRQLLELVAQAGGGGVGVNPLHALAEDNPEEASPYAPSSRIFLNWLYIDVGSLPYVEPNEIDAARPRQSEADGLIDYAGVAAAKEKLLRLAWRRFSDNASAAERLDFSAFRQEIGPDLRRYAVFCFLRRREGGAWRYWRRPWANPEKQDIEALVQEEADEIGFHEFVQYQAHAQLARCKEYAQAKRMAIGLYLDVAVGVHPDGFDAWNDPEAFLQGASIGAPPDALNKAGQNWGLTSFHPLTLRQRAFEPFRRMLRASMQYAGAIRIDHVLGLNRLYVIPPGGEPTQGVYVKYPLEDLLAVAAMESQYHRCLIIGEDLGTVPDGLRETLREYGIWTYRVVMFERDEEGYLTANKYPRTALATFSTHDLPTYAGWLKGEDIELMGKLGLPLADDSKSRAKDVAALAKVFGSAGPTPSFRDMARFLARTPSSVIAYGIEDLMGLSRQINMPGTYREYPNWRHAMRFEPSEIGAKLRELQSSVQELFGAKPRSS